LWGTYDRGKAVGFHEKSVCDITFRKKMWRKGGRSIPRRGTEGVRNVSNILYLAGRQKKGRDVCGFHRKYEIWQLGRKKVTGGGGKRGGFSERTSEEQGLK